MRGGKIKKVSDFMYLSGFSGDFMEGETFWCIAEAVYQGFSSASPHQNIISAPDKKYIDELLQQYIRTSHAP